MRTISLILCAFIALLGCYLCFFKYDMSGVALILIGTLSFLIIVQPTKRITDYHPMENWNE